MKQDNFSTFVVWSVVLVVTLMLLWLKGCTDEDGTRKALSGAGYTSIKLTGYQFFTCEDDSTCTGFEAVGPTGKRVTGAVGCGWFAKGCTIRSD